MNCHNIVRVASDPESGATNGGTPTCKFRVVSDKYIKKEKVPSFHNVVAYGKLAENCVTYLKKGAQCYLEGYYSVRPYEKDGQKRNWYEVEASKVEFIFTEKKNSDVQVSDENATPILDQKHEIKTDPQFTADDIPF